MIIDQKKIPQVILSRMRESGPALDSVQKNEESDSPLHAICQDILAAVENKSASDLATALQAAFEALQSGPDTDDDGLETDAQS